MLEYSKAGEGLLEKLFGDPTRKWWTSSSGRIELSMSVEQIEMVPLSGHAEFGIALLRQEKEIRTQIDKIKPEVLTECLDEYGTWDDEQLKDHEANIDRLLWIAACDIQEEE